MTMTGYYGLRCRGDHCFIGIGAMQDGHAAGRKHIRKHYRNI